MTVLQDLDYDDNMGIICYISNVILYVYLNGCIVIVSLCKLKSVNGGDYFLSKLSV